MRSPGVWVLILTLTLISGCALDLAGKDYSLKSPQNKFTIRQGHFFSIVVQSLTVFDLPPYRQQYLRLRGPSPSPGV